MVGRSGQNELHVAVNEICYVSLGYCVIGSWLSHDYRDEQVLLLTLIYILAY